MKESNRATKQKTATAYHEAGHALAAVLLNKKFKYVTIRANDDSLGHVLSKRGNRYQYQFYSITDPSRFSKYFLADFSSIAGLVSEKMHSGRNNFSGAKGDFDKIIFRSISDLSESFSKKYLAFLIEYTINVFSLATNQICLNAIANELIEKETMTYSDVRRVMHESLIKKSHA